VELVRGATKRIRGVFNVPDFWNGSAFFEVLTHRAARAASSSGIK
jgi:hypothetical protein